MKRSLFLGLLFVSSAAAAQDYNADLFGWSISDVGHKPGDDNQRSVVIEKAIPTVHLTYGPNGKGNGGSFRADFKASKGCDGYELHVAFDFDGDRADPATVVRKEIHAGFLEFGKRCPGKAIGEAELMTGFDQAFAAVHKRVTENPYVYPPESVSSQRSAAQPKSQGQ